MATQEYYIRGVNDTEARGPFTVEQLVTLGETGQIDTETLFYDATTEQWAAIGSNEELKDAVFPQKKKLTFKAKETRPGPQYRRRRSTGPSPSSRSSPPPRAARRRRRTCASRIAAQHTAAQDRLVCRRWSIFLLSAAALLLPNVDIVLAFDLGKIVEAAPHPPRPGRPGVRRCCSAWAWSSAYPFIRFRAAFGLGFLGLLFWSQDHPHVALAIAAGSVGMYFCTVFLSYVPVITAALLGLAGIGGFAFFMLT